MTEETEKRIDELYKNLFDYLEELKELSLTGDRQKSKELFTQYVKDSNELGELLIQEGKDAGQIDAKLEKEIRDRQKILNIETEERLSGLWS
jgi:gas vesicle protein